MEVMKFGVVSVGEMARLREMARLVKAGACRWPRAGGRLRRARRHHR